MHTYVEIMDTTLRDGEQTDGVSFSSFEKMQISRMLLEKLHVDRIEIASARVSPGEYDTVKEIFADMARKGLDDRVEILGFVDYKASVDWIGEAGGRVINLLTKGSRKHCEEQLGKTLEGHLVDIEKTVSYALSNNFVVNIYLEDWSNGFLNSVDYVENLLSELMQMKINRILLPDTLGILSPEEVHRGISHALERHPNMEVDFHGHNDYGLATANCLAAVRAGAKGVHLAVNGLGERAGNSPLETVVTALHDKLNVRTHVHEKAIMDVSRMVETFSGKRVASNQPVVGHDVYTQTAGIHADGDKKNNLYANPILPERFGRKRVYALGKLSGKASISNNLKALGMEISPEREKLLLDLVKKMGEQKKSLTLDDLPFLMDDLFGQGSGIDKMFRIKEAHISTVLGHRSTAGLELEIRDKRYSAFAGGDGGYDAFMNALHLIAEDLNIPLPRLVDYEVRIPPGGKTDALVEAIVVWRYDSQEHNFRTSGLDPDQATAAIKATEKMLNRYVAPNIDPDRLPLVHSHP